MQRPLAVRLPLAHRTLRAPAGLSPRGLPAALTQRLRRDGRARRMLLIGLPLLALLGGAWLWLRDSPLVAVEHVRVSGVRGPEAGAIEDALRTAGERMSTLDVNTAALRAAVAQFPIVREVRASASFPHALHIEVIEQPPVAALVVGNGRTAVAADGVVLGAASLGSRLPNVSAYHEPPVGGRVRGAQVRAELAVLGAAPAVLAARIASVFEGAQGITVAMRSGLLAYFGNASTPHAKWIALARVLADPSSAGASYVDVRLPAHPAAGFPGGVAPAASSNGTSGEAPASGQAPAGGESASSSEAIVAALAEELRTGVAGSSAPVTGMPAGTSASTSGAPAPVTPEAAAGASAPSSTAAATSGAGAEAAAAPSGTETGAGTTSSEPPQG